MLFGIPFWKPLFVCERNLYSLSWFAKTVAHTYRPDVINVYTFHGLEPALNNQADMYAQGDLYK